MTPLLHRFGGWSGWKPSHLLLFVGICLLLLPLSFFPGFRMVESRVFDVVSTISPPDPADSSVILVGIDEASFAELGLQWPWPRALHGQLIESLTAAGAAVIALDIVFAERSTPDSDAVLTQAITDAVPVVLAADLALEENRYISQLVRIEPLDDFLKAGGMPGIAAVSLDPDGVIRQLPTYNDGFAITILRAWEKLNGAELTVSPSGHPLIQFFGSAGSYPLVSYYQALRPKQYLPPGIFKDRIVIVGRAVKNTPDPGARQADTFATAFTRSSATLMAGAEVHANILDNLRLGLAIRPVAEGVRQILAILVVIFSLFLFRKWHPRKSSLQALVMLALILLGSILLLRLGRIWLSPLLPLLALLLSFGTRAVVRFREVHLERRRIKQAFGRYLSPSLVEQLAVDPSRLQLGGETRCLTIMFCDVRGFTTLSERFGDDPEGLISVMNRFFTAMTGVILEHGGTVDKYIGDCIMAFWNAPLDDPAHATHACAAALDMVTALTELNGEFAEEPVADGGEALRLNIGIGLNSGRCLVGNLGSKQRFDYSVLGDAVNLSSRLEGQTKNYGVQIVIGPKTADEAEGVALLELDKIVVKGKIEAVQIYTILGFDSFGGEAAAHAFVENHAAFIQSYRRCSWQEGRKLLTNCRKEQRALLDLYTIYEERIQDFEISPPPSDWDGVVVAKTK